MNLPSNNVRDYPNLTRVVNQFVAEINSKNPYHYNGKAANLWNVKYYYVQDGAFIIEYEWFGSAAAMSIEFGSRGRIDGDGGRKEAKKRANPPFTRIFEWAKKKGIRGHERRSSITGRYIQGNRAIKQAAWRIVRKIGDHGTEAKGYGRQLVAEIFPRYEEDFNDAVALDIEYQITKYYPDLTK